MTRKDYILIAETKIMHEYSVAATPKITREMVLNGEEWTPHAYSCIKVSAPDRNAAKKVVREQFGLVPRAVSKTCTC